jgi:hypothetical protein
MTRNPYAHCEGMMRRDKITTEAAAHFSIKCLRLSVTDFNAEGIGRLTAEQTMV